MSEKKKEENKEEKDERQFVKVYTEFMEDKKYESRDQLVYLLLKGFADRRFGGLTISGVDSILRILGMAINTRNKSNIKESIETLIGYNVIKMYEEFSCIDEKKVVEHWNTYFFKVTDSMYENEYFTKFYHEDLEKFLKMNEKNKAKVFAVYHNIVARMYHMEGSDRFTMPSIETISSQTGINRKTIPKYLKALMESELLYYSVLKNKMNKDNTAYITKNVYSRWEHREYVDHYIRKKTHEMLKEKSGKEGIGE